MIRSLGKLGKVFDFFSPAAAEAPPSAGASEAEAPSGFDTDALTTEVLEFIKDCDKTRHSFERLWFRSILYFLGNQWLSWDSRSRKWGERKLRKWVPRPVTNRFASTVSSLCAAIQSTRVEPTAWPATNDHEDIATANVADRLIEVIRSEIKHDKVREALAKWVTLNADGFAWPYYDKKDTSLGMATIFAVKCAACGVEGAPTDFATACPGCGSPADPMEIPDPKHPAATQYPVGRLKCRVLSPLSVYFNMDIVDPEDRRKVCVAVAYEVQTVKDMFPDVADKIQPDTAAATRTAQHFMEALAYATEDSGQSSGSGSKEKCTLLHYMALPTEQYPEGVQYTMTMEGQPCEVGPLESYDESKDGNKTYFIPLVQFGYEKVPGRAYSKTPAYDLLSKQDQLNRLESLMELASMKGVSVNWLLPAGASISNLSGEPAQVIRWTPTGTGGAKPEVVTVAPFHAAMFELKKGYEADFEELGGTFDVLKGNTPSGVSAGYAIQLLTERSYGRFAPVFANWEAGWTELYSMCIKLFRTYATEPRFTKIKGARGLWEIQSFSNANLAGAIDLKVEGGSSRPRSKLAEQALVEMLFKIGAINPQDPDQKFELCKMFGMSSILGSGADDERAAASEWQELLDWEPEIDPMSGMPLGVTPENPFPPGGPMVDQVFDNHLAHMMTHRKPVKTEDWNQLPEWKKHFWRMHQLDHMMAIPPPPDAKPSGSGGPVKSGTKAEEMPDSAANMNKGSVSAGSGGANQHGG